VSVLHCSEGMRGVSIVGLLAVQSVHLPTLTSILFVRGTDEIELLDS